MAIAKKRKFTTEELELIRTQTTTTEKRNTALKHGYIIDIIYKVLRRDRNITTNTEPIFIELLKTAKSNHKNSLKNVN